MTTPTRGRPTEELYDLLKKHVHAFADRLARQPRYGAKRARSWLKSWAHETEERTAEALLWRMLTAAKLEVEYETYSYTSKKTGSLKPVDFVLEDQQGVRVVAELTTISGDKVQEQTQMPDVRAGSGGAFGGLDQPAWHAFRRKAEDLLGIELPALIVLGSFHPDADFLFEMLFEDFVLGRPIMQVLRPGTEAAESRRTHDFERAAFLRPPRIVCNEAPAERTHIGGLLLVAFGDVGASCRMIKHHEPSRALPMWFDQLPTTTAEIRRGSRHDAPASAGIQYTGPASKRFVWEYL